MPLYAEGNLLTGLRARARVVRDYCPMSATSQVMVSGRHGENWLVRLTGAAYVQGNASHYSNGLYKASYMTPRAETYSMAVSLAEARGLQGEYFNNRWLQGEPTFTRVDEVVNFRWPTFITTTGKDAISVRWTGFVQPGFSDVYTFCMDVNDGVKMWVDGEVVIDEFENSVDDTSGPEFVELCGSTSQPLTANRLYDIKIEYREDAGVAIARLMWSSFRQGKGMVPAYRLFHSHSPIYESPFTVQPVGVIPTRPTGASLDIMAEDWSPFAGPDKISRPSARPKDNSHGAAESPRRLYEHAAVNQ